MQGPDKDCDDLTVISFPSALHRFKVIEQARELKELRQLERLHDRIRTKFADPLVVPLPRGVLAGNARKSGGCRMASVQSQS